MQAETQLAKRAHALPADSATPAFVQADAECIAFVPALFDVILCCSAMQYFPDVHAVLRNARRWLREDGCLVFNAAACTETVSCCAFHAMIATGAVCDLGCIGTLRANNLPFAVCMAAELESLHNPQY